MLKWFKGCKLTLDFLVELRLNFVAEVTIGPYQLVVEGSFGGGDGISDTQSIVSAGCCNLITRELPVVGKEIYFFGASIFIGEELGSFASWKHYEAWIQDIILLPGSFCVAEALCVREVVFEAIRILVGGVDFLDGIALFHGDGLDELKHVLRSYWLSGLLLEERSGLSGFFNRAVIVNFKLKYTTT